MARKETNQSKVLLLSASPHFHAKSDTSKIMLDVIIALLPAVIAATVIFGWKVLLNIVVSVLTCVVAEYVSRKVMKCEMTISDLSAVVTGIILALNVPADFPVWQLMLGAIGAIVIAKQIFGGLGQNFVNPAMIARLMLVVSFATSFVVSQPVLGYSSVDAASSATPMAILGSGTTDGAPSLMDMFFGVHGSLAVGETCAAAILLGLIYLLVRKVIKPHIPVAYVGTVAVLSLLFGGFDLNFVLYQILGGGLLFGAVFMATDYATSPLTNKGKIVFGIGLGLITCVIRFWGNLPEGVSYSIVIMNILTPHIDNWTRSPIFGQQKKVKQKEVKA